MFYGLFCETGELGLMGEDNGEHCIRSGQIKAPLNSFNTFNDPDLYW